MLSTAGGADASAGVLGVLLCPRSPAPPAPSGFSAPSLLEGTGQGALCTLNCSCNVVMFKKHCNW